MRRNSRSLWLELLEDRTVPAGLSLALADSALLEGLATVATVTRDGDLSQPLTVQLSSSDTTEATVPTSVVIPAGQASATVAVQAVADTSADGTQQVTLTAQATIPLSFVRVSGSTQPYMTQALASMPDGRYVTAGLRYSGSLTSFDVGVSRFLPDGQPDTSFGGSGTVVTDVSGGRYDTTNAVLVQPDGKVLVAGYTTIGAGPYANMFVLRYNENGTLDPTFGSGGKVVLNFGSTSRSEVWDLALQSDGKIILGGMIDLSDTTFGDHAVVRLTPSGASDYTFGTSGRVTTDFAPTGTDTAYAVLVQPDGKIILAGQGSPASTSASLSLARYNANGTLDTTFGSGGMTSLNVPGIYEAINDITLRPDGKLVAVGKVQPTGATSNNPYDWVLAQFNANGTLDPSFGNGGTITYDFGGDDQAQALVLMAGDTFAVAGYGVGNISASSRKPVLAQFTPDGRQILSSLVLPRNDALGYGLVYQNGLLQVAGSSSTSTTGGFVDDYTPDAGGLITATAILSVLDDDPNVQPDAYDVGEDQTFTAYGFGVLANDYSPNGNLTAALVSGPAHGTLSLSPGGSFTYTPDPNYFGPDSFVYRATDPAGLSGDATVSLTVWGLDDPIQLAAPGLQTMVEDTSLTFSTASGNAITVTDIESPRVLVALLVQDGILTLPGTVGLEFPYPDSINNSPHITFYADNPAEANAALNGLVFTPNLNYNGAVYLSVMVQDMTIVAGYPVQASANVPITVTAVNDAPVAASDSYQAYEDQTLTVSGLGVLGNDSDPDSDMLSAILVSGPAHGTVTLGLGGNFTYTPAPNYFGADSFTYRATDPSGLSAPATVSLDVWGMDDPIQVSAPGPQTIAEDTSLTFSVANGTALTVTDIESPRVLVALLVQDGILTLPSTAGLEFPDPTSLNDTAHVTFYADDPAEANAALNGLVFTPNPNYHGTVYFNFWVQDTTFVSFPLTASASVPITVTAVNDAPVAVNDNYAVAAGVPFVTTPFGGFGNSLGVLANDQDVDWDLLSAVLVSGPAHGTLTFNPDGSFTYTPDAAYSGADSFTYRASDGQLQSGLGTATFIVTQDQPPVSIGDDYAVNEDTILSVPASGVLGNDIDPDGQPLTAQLVNGPTHGTLTLDPNGSFTYTPAANYNGPDQFWYRASDGVNLGDAVVVTLTVNPVNDGPVVSNDGYSLNEDNVLTVAASGVLANDADIDSATLTAALVSGPSHGVLSLNADGSFSYTPNANYNGGDSFTYRVNDGQSDSNVATVTLTVNSINDAPVAVDDAYSVNEDQTLTIAPTPGVTALNMISQAGDYIGQGLTYSFTPQTGTFLANRNFDNGVSVFYSGGGQSWNLDFAAPFDANLTPGDYANATRWPFQASGVPGLNVSGNGRSANTLTGNFTVTQALYAADGKVLRFAATFEQHSDGAAPALTGEIQFNQGDGPSGILVNDSNVEGNPLTIIVVSNPAHGTLSMNVDGSFTYRPTANYNGTDSFSYKLSDGTTESNVATVSLTVNPVNDFPTANNDSYVVAEDNVLTVAAPGVLANDSDVDGDSLTATLVTSTTHGSLAFNADGSFTYTPQANYNGSDSFQYAARDGSAFSFIRTVTLTVTSVNDTPTASNDSYTTAEDTPLTVAAAGVLANDADVEGTTLTALLVNGPAHGTLTLNSNGSFTYTPNADYHGLDSFSYRANDGNSDSNVATVSLTVSAVNDAPTATDDSYSVTEDQSLTISAPGVLGNDSDVDGDSLSAVLVSGPVHGIVNLNADGSFSYTPSANYHGSDSFTYKVNDDSLASNVVTVTLAITSVNDVPLVDAGFDQTVTEGSTVAFQGTTLDADGDALSYLWNFGDGATSTAAAPTHLYADNGVYTVTLTVNDSQGGVVSDSLVVAVLNVAPTLTLSGASAVNEGSTYTLNLAASDPGQDTIANWTITWGDGSVQTVAGNPGSVSHTYADGTRSYAITATASDEDGTHNAGNSVNVTVSNVAPIASISSPTTGVRGQLLSFALGATDPSALDQAGSFTFNINWGDGSSEPSTGAANQQVSHIYTAAGTYTIQITATDRDGGSSTTVQQTITINAVGVQAGALVIGGTTANDSITVAPADASGALAITINGVSQGTFAAPTQLVVYGQAGGDQIKLATRKIASTTYYVTVPAALFGEDGNDTLDARGSTANNILVGGAGSDVLQGGSGRDLLLGGAGTDTLHGNGGEDIVIGNATDHDTHLNALNTLMAEWGRTDASYTTRINHLNGSSGGGLNNGYFLNSSTVHDDAAIDQLYGDSDSDWFFYTASGSYKDKLNSLSTGEVATGQ